MRGINLFFDYDEDDIQTRLCIPEKIVELSSEQFSLFKAHPQDDHQYLIENEEDMYESERGTYHGLLLVNNVNDDGIFVMNTLFKREIAYVPFARYYLEKEQYPALAEYCSKMIRTVDEQTSHALHHQQEGKFQIHMAALVADNRHLDEDLFMQMMSNRDEFEYAEGGWDDTEDILYLGIADEYKQIEDDSSLKPLTQKDVDIICAKHTLWFNNVGGEQADFTNCLLRDINLSRKELCSAIFDGAKLVNCTFSGSDFSYSSFVGARLIDCEGFTLIAKESDFTDANISLSDFSCGDYSGGNFTRAIFRGCNVQGTNFSECCLDRAEFADTNEQNTLKSDCFYDEREWATEKEGLEMKGCDTL